MKQKYFPRWLWLSVAVVAFGTALGYWLVTHPRVASRPPTSPLAQVSEDNEELHALQPGEAKPAAQLPPVFQSASRSAANVSPAAPRAEPTPETRQLVSSLAELDPSRGPITKEQAEVWKQGLQELIQHGATGVPAIREFLERNLEHNYAGIEGGDLLGQSSLRTALIDALHQIGGPEALAVMAQTLQTTALPPEIALLARYVEQQAPGEYRQETLNAVRDALDMASKGQLREWDVGSLFQVLQDYGDASTAPELEQRQAQWRYYATISLAKLPAGEGIPTLIRQVQDPASAMTSGKGELAFQMLAQASVQHPEAIAALLEQAGSGKIPDSAWQKIALGLAGNQYQVGQPPAEIMANPARQNEMQTFHVESGNQNFHSLPLATIATPEEIETRRALIGQLLSATSSPAAVLALESAQNLLANARAAAEAHLASNPTTP